MSKLGSILGRMVNASNASGSNSRTNASSDMERSSEAFPVLIGLIVAGFIGILIYSLTSTNVAMTTSIGFMIAGATLLLGGSIGFLFGLPRTMINDRLPPKDTTTNLNAGNEGIRDLEFQPNTNLEEISDWLTKILVGVGLTQLSGISRSLDRAASAIQDGLGSSPENHVFSLAILLYFPVCGFLTGYLWTRLNLPTAFTRAERARRREEELHQATLVAFSLAAQTAKDRVEEGALVKEPKRGLWVDDNPSNNASLKQSFENLLGIEIDLSLSTEDALQKVKSAKKYSFIISDMRRPPDQQAGYTLLSKLKEIDKFQLPPYIIYAFGGSNPALQDMAKKEGSAGSTNSPQDLLQLIRDALAQTPEPSLS